MSINPILRSYKTQLLYAGVWIVICIIQTTVLSNTTHLSTGLAAADSFLFNGLLAFLLLPLWFPVYHNPMHHKPWYYNVVRYIVLGAVLLTVWLSLGYLLMYAIGWDNETYLLFLRKSIWWRALEGVLFYAVAVLMYYLDIFIVRLNEKVENEIRLTRLIKDSELNVLKSQINPHFLFNSLNSVNSLIIVNPAQAQQMLIALSDYLRYMVLATNRATACIRDELENCERYLAIEKLRFGEKLNYTISVQPECTAVEIPSMLLQPLFENAVKHGVYESLQAISIEVQVQQNGEHIIIKITNDFEAGNNVPKKGSGTGLQNIRERLRLSYGDKATFYAKAEGGKFTAAIEIPAPPAPKGGEKTL